MTASDDGTARLWQTDSGKDIALLSGHTAAVTHVEFSPNGAFVITASRDGTARLWESGNGTVHDVRSLRQFDRPCGTGRHAGNARPNRR